MRIQDLLESRAHPCIVVDVQPEYCGIADGDEDPVCVDIIKFVTKQTGPVLMFVNAEESGLSGDTVADVKLYWEDTLCPEEDRYDYDTDLDEYVVNPNCPQVDWRRFTIVDKGYGYFRAWMDSGVSPAAIIRVIRALYQYGLYDSRQLQEKDTQILPQLVGNEWQDWMEDDPITIQWTSVAQLKRFAGSYIMGGGRNECLREVELLMNAFNIPYKRIDSLVYG